MGTILFCCTERTTWDMAACLPEDLASDEFIWLSSHMLLFTRRFPDHGLGADHLMSSVCCPPTCFSFREVFHFSFMFCACMEFKLSVYRCSHEFGSFWLSPSFLHASGCLSCHPCEHSFIA